MRSDGTACSMQVSSSELVIVAKDTEEYLIGPQLGTIMMISIIFKFHYCFIIVGNL